MRQSAIALLAALALVAPALAHAEVDAPVWQRLAAELRADGTAEIDAPGDLRLTGVWSLPPGTLVIRAGGDIATRELRLSAPGLHLTLAGRSVLLGARTRLDLASAGSGGSAELVADGGGVDLADDSTIDVSGAALRGGRILLHGDRVAARGELLARGRGRIEVEARRGLRFTSHADTAGGLIRLDPSNMVIGNFAGTDTGVASGTSGTALTRSPSADTGQLDAGNLATLLGTNDVIVHTLASGSAIGIALPAGFPGTPALDPTGGDIDVQADVVWSSTHFLWLLAHDDLIVRAKVQNAGAATGGSVVGIAGWDGTTFTGLDTDPLPAGVYGGGTGDAYVLGPAGLSSSPTFNTAFGSRLGATVLAGRDVRVQGSTDTNGNNGFAMVGYRVDTASDATGDIRVRAKGSLRVLGGLTPTAGGGTFRGAQIGHGGCLNGGTDVNALGTVQGNLSGAISVVAGGALEVKTGTLESQGQIGHGGCLSLGSTRGNIDGDIDVTAASVLLQQENVGTISVQTYAAIGNGGMELFGKDTAGTIGGDIHVTTTSGDLVLLPTGTSVVSETRIGHGGTVDTTFDAGNSPFVRSSIGAMTGDITVSVAGDLHMEGGTTFQAYSQIGHGGYILAAGLMGPASGGIDVTVGRDALLTSTSATVGNPRPAQIGHGGGTRAVFVPAGGLPTSERQALSGPIHLTVGRELRLLPGPTQVSYVQVGHGSLLWTEQQNTVAKLESASGDITVQASTIEMRGGTGDANTGGVSYAQIGNGGPAILLNINTQAPLGPVSGNIQVTTTGVSCLAGPPTPPLLPLTCGDLVMVGGPAAAGGSYAWIGHDGEPYDTGVGNLGTQAGASGNVTVNVAHETNLENGPTDFWHIGHLLLAGNPITASDVSLDTATLDFSSLSSSTNATINDPRFWPQYVFESPASGVDYADNVDGGSVSLRVRGNGGNDGAIIDAQPLLVPASAAHPVVVRATDDFTLSSSVTNDGSSVVDLVDDDAAADQNPPNASLSAQFTIDASGSIVSPAKTRVFAVSPLQFTPGSYTPPAIAFGVWYETAGSPVVGANFKLAVDADLSLTKTDAPDPVTAGSNLGYTITVTNSGPAAAGTVSWSDSLPTGTTFVSLPAVAGWTCTTPAVGAGGTVTCSNPSVAVGATPFLLTVNVDPGVAAGTVLSNSATVTSATNDPNPGNETGTTTTTVTTAADLGATKVDTPDPVTAGTNLTYTITVDNAGPSTAASATLSDTLPAGTTFVSLSSPAGWSCTTPAVGASGTVSCTNPGVAVGNGVFTLVVAVGPGVAAGTVVSNTATVGAATTDPAPGNGSATATTTVATAADLGVTKLDTPDPVMAGGNLTYTITVTNAGPSVAATAALSDTLPAGTTFVSLSSPAGWSCTTPAVGSGGAVSCTNPSMAVGNGVFTLVVAVGSAVADGTVLSNTATASAATTDPTPGNESGTATTTVATAADLGVTKVDTPDPVMAGGNLTYTITVTNAGPSVAATAALSDTLPAGTTFVSLSSPAGWSCTAPPVGGSGTVSCTNAGMPVGNGVFTLVVAVGSGVANGTVISNTATVSATTADPSTGNESATATTTVAVAMADLGITKVDTPDPVTAGSNITYTITAINAGPNSATSAALSDTLPAGTTFVSLSSPAGWSCTAPAVGAGGTVSCSNPSMPVGNGVFTLVVAVGSGLANGTVISNTATVSAATTDPSPGNESATATTTVTVPPPGASLSASKSVSGSFVAGSAVTYTIVITNNASGAQNDDPGHELTDVLPASLALVSASATAGTAVATVGTNTVTWDGSLAAGASVTITIQATILAADAPGTTVSNQANLAFDSDANGTNESTGVSDDPAVGGAADPTTFVVGAAHQPPAPIPTLGEVGFLALALLLATAGVAWLRRSATGG